MPFLHGRSSPSTSFPAGRRWRRIVLLAGIIAGHLVLFAIIGPPIIDHAPSEPPVVFSLAPPAVPEPRLPLDKPRAKNISGPVIPQILLPRLPEPRLLQFLPVPVPVTEQPILNTSDADKVFDLYRLQLEAHLALHRRYPPDARRRWQEGIAEVAFIIAADGSVTSVTLLESSRYRALDREAIGLIHRCAPFPPPPSAASPLHISLPVIFELQQGGG